MRSSNPRCSNPNFLKAQCNKECLEGESFVSTGYMSGLEGPAQMRNVPEVLMQTTSMLYNASEESNILLA